MYPQDFEEVVGLQFKRGDEWIPETRDYTELQITEAAHFVWPTHWPCCYLGEMSERRSIEAK